MNTTTTEKWQWLNDLTNQPADTSFDTEATAEENQDALRQDIAEGFQWKCEEERIGKWLGLVIAVIVWGIVIICYITSHPLENTVPSTPEYDNSFYEQMLKNM